MDFLQSIRKIIVEVKKINKKVIVFSVIFIVIFSSSMIGSISARPFYKNISVAETQKMVLSNGHPDLIVIDLRPDFMYSVGHIPGAINVPIPALGVWIAGEGQNHLNNKIIVHCLLGQASPDAAQILVDAGFKKVLNMEGGFMAWLSADYIVEP